MKSEPAECSITDLANAPGQQLPWVGVRNYQARNFMRDAMHIGDGVLFYHSSCREPGIAGIAEIASNASVDATQFDPNSPYFDAKSHPAAPRWVHVDVRYRATATLLPLQTLRQQAALASMPLLRRGNRLSITPVTPHEWRTVLGLLQLKA